MNNVMKSDKHICFLSTQKLNYVYGHQFKAMIEENQQLLTGEPVKFEN